MDMAERLYLLRKESGRSQEQVAEMLEVSRQAVSKWESGQGKPDVDNVIKLAQIYDVSADYILLGREPVTAVPAQEKGGLSKETRKAIAIISIIAATAAITALFISALWFLAKFVF